MRNRMLKKPSNTVVSQLIKVSPVVIRNKVPTEAGAQEAQVADTRHNYDNDNYKNYDVG